MTLASVAWLASTSALTMASTRAICSAVMGASCAKSKRVLSGSTSEPRCCTWAPSTSRKALCIRCVAEWLRTVRARRTASTRASKVSPTFSAPASSVP
ncbi:Uncharacterised protein [Bordetella pertussis]|nr:Uncharacterised protein [Bordetella pertussis]CFW04020.1 Uncharacterised protein [Bordetella pertussis]